MHGSRPGNHRRVGYLAIQARGGEAIRILFVKPFHGISKYQGKRVPPSRRGTRAVMSSRSQDFKSSFPHFFGRNSLSGKRAVENKELIA